jgi:hypothetical protein
MFNPELSLPWGFIPSYLAPSICRLRCILIFRYQSLTPQAAVKQRVDLSTSPIVIVSDKAAI